MELTGIGLSMEGVIQQQMADFLDHEPTKAEKIEISKARKIPSGWLKLLCPDWASANGHIVEATDLKLLEYKPYLKGQLSSQLLCRLSIPEQAKEFDIPDALNFWKILGITDDFDRAYIISQIERFCILYSIRANFTDDDLLDPAVIGEISAPAGDVALLVRPEEVAAATNYVINTSMEASAISSSFTLKGDDRLLDTDSRRQVIKNDQRRVSLQKREVRQREREAASERKIAHKAAKEANREEKRQKKFLLRKQREKSAEKQKDAALRRAAELVRSNRVPIEITRGAMAAQAAANAAVAMMGVTTYQKEETTASIKKLRSAIVVSNASDLNQIVTHSKNLWMKYNAIAKEHNQKVNWITVAKELGIHVKVREKYARMHARALHRGFDFDKCGHFKIKQHPEIFLEPLTPEQKSKLEPQSQDPNNSVMMVHCPKEISHPVSTISDDQVAAAVDAAIKTVPVPQSVVGFDDASAAATAVDAVMKINDDDNGDDVVEHTVDISVADATTAALAAAPNQDCIDI